jgi:hypothetical protein
MDYICFLALLLRLVANSLQCMCFALFSYKVLKMYRTRRLIYSDDYV